MTVPAPTKTQVEQFLRGHFKKPRSWLMRLVGEPLEWSGEIGVVKEPIEPVETGNLFERHRVFRVYAREDLLQRVMLPTGATNGLFSFDGCRLRYLSAESSGELETVLRAERPAFQEADAGMIASLFSEILLNVGCKSHAIVPTLDSLIHYKANLQFGGGYRINERELASISHDFTDLSLAGNADQGWTLTYCSLFGWMHEKHELGVERFDVTPDYWIARSTRKVLSRKIFAAVPCVVY